MAKTASTYTMISVTIFIQPLADLDRSFKYKVEETQLEFIEQDKSGNFHKEGFKITPEEISGLKKLIRETIADIRSLNFDRTTNYDHCVRCDFRTHCWPNGLPLTGSNSL
jgi:hypothetical protein